MGPDPPLLQENVQLGAGMEADSELNPLSPREVPQLLLLLSPKDGRASQSRVHLINGKRPS